MKATQAGQFFNRQASSKDKSRLREKLEEGRTRPTVAKRLQGYDQTNPRCSNCKDFLYKGVALTSNSKSKVVQLYCGLGHFSVKAGGCCDLWSGRDGSVLESRSASEGN